MLWVQIPPGAGLLFISSVCAQNWKEELVTNSENSGTNKLLEIDKFLIVRVAYLDRKLVLTKGGTYRRS